VKNVVGQDSREFVDAAPYSVLLVLSVVAVAAEISFVDVSAFRFPLIRLMLFAFRGKDRNLDHHQVSRLSLHHDDYGFLPK